MTLVTCITQSCPCHVLHHAASSALFQLSCQPLPTCIGAAGGNAWNQLAVLDALGGDVASSVANYCRSLACERPYEVSKVRAQTTACELSMRPESPADGTEPSSWQHHCKVVACERPYEVSKVLSHIMISSMHSVRVDRLCKWNHREFSTWHGALRGHRRRCMACQQTGQLEALPLGSADVPCIFANGLRQGCNTSAGLCSGYWQPLLAAAAALGSSQGTRSAEDSQDSVSCMSV